MSLLTSKHGRNDSVGARHSCRRNVDLPISSRVFESRVPTPGIAKGSSTGDECGKAVCVWTLLRNECRAPAISTASLGLRLLVLAAGLFVSAQAPAAALSPIVVSKDGSRFELADSGKPFRVWGVNYDHQDGSGRLLEDYWHDEWATVVEDFGEIRDLGANVVRIHLQFGAFMESPTKPNAKNPRQLSKLIALAETNGLYLDITGLGCYHKKDVPAWYDALDEKARWAAQAAFWSSVAKTCAKSPAIFCYDLMNEPILPGGKKETAWLAGEFGGKHFVQRISLDLKGRNREEVAKAWVDTLVAAIRKHDQWCPITVGVIPWALTWPNAKPLFYSPTVSEKLDIVAVHFYPRKGEVAKALAALKVYDIGKPIVVEEIFPLSCGMDELEQFMKKANSVAEGWVSFYWGKTADDYAREKDGGIAAAIKGAWIKRFKELAPEMTASPK